MPAHLTPPHRAQSHEQLYHCIHNFICHEKPSALLHTMNHLLNAFIDASDMDGTDRLLVADIVYDTTRINAFFAELYEIVDRRGNPV